MWGNILEDPSSSGVPVYPGGTSYPARSDAPAQQPTGAQDIYNLMQQINKLNEPDLSAVDKVTVVDPALNKKRLIGTLIAGALGALANRGRSGGALAGLAEGASGFEKGATGVIDRSNTAKLKMIEDANKTKHEVAAAGLRQLFINRFPNAGDMKIGSTAERLKYRISQVGLNGLTPNERQAWNEMQRQNQFITSLYTSIRNKNLYDSEDEISEKVQRALDVLSTGKIPGPAPQRKSGGLKIDPNNFQPR